MTERPRRQEETKSSTPCHPYRGRRGSVRCGCRHGRMMDAFDLATELWWSHAETATCLYPTELAEYRSEHPVPHLSDFMKASF